MKRIDKINTYLEQGKTYEEIGDILGVSRQRIEQIIKKSNPSFSKYVYRRKPLRVNAQYRQEGNFLTLNEWYDFTLTEEIRPTSKERLIYYLEIKDNNKDIKITYTSLEELLKDWSNVNLL